MIFFEPKRSDAIPIKGWKKPNNKFCKAIAKLKNSRPVPNVSEIGIIKIPNDCLIPRLKIKMPIPNQTRRGKRKILINDARLRDRIEMSMINACGDETWVFHHSLHFVGGSHRWSHVSLVHLTVVGNGEQQPK